MSRPRSEEEAYYAKLYSARAEADRGQDQSGGQKRQDYWSWEQFHMSVAFLSAKRSRDPNTQVCSQVCLS